MSGWASAITAAIGSMTPAQQVLFQPRGSARSANGTRRRRRKSAAKTTRRKGKKKGAARRARGGKAARFVKGSAAAKRHMAKLRRMRRR